MPSEHKNKASKECLVAALDKMADAAGLPYYGALEQVTSPRHLYIQSCSRSQPSLRWMLWWTRPSRRQTPATERQRTKLSSRNCSQISLVPSCGNWTATPSSSPPTPSCTSHCPVHPPPCSPRRSRRQVNKVTYIQLHGGSRVLVFVLVPVVLLFVWSQAPQHQQCYAGSVATWRSAKMQVVRFV